MGQQPSQIEVFSTNIAVADLPPSSSQQQLQYNQDPQVEVEAGDDQHHDSEEEIEALIEDELVHLHQENERFRLEQEHITRWRVVMQRAQIMQQQIEQEKARQIELQQVIDTLREQEQEPLLQQPSP
jgi:hypothetical protein